MFAAIVPVFNEESRVGRLLGRLVALPAITEIYVIENGSNRSTKSEVQEAYHKNKNKIKVIHFREPLGIDVPRAVGAKLAYDSKAEYAFFVDGDLVGEITHELSHALSQTALKRPDLALIDCYPQAPARELCNEPLFFFRRLLNTELGLYDRIRIASPSHGPHLVSRRMLSLVPWQDFCIPPTLLAYAVAYHMRTEIIGTIPHIRLGSQIKNSTHSQLIVDTIAGDCLEALCMAKHVPRERVYEGKTYSGYHGQRRFDLLNQFIAGRFMR
jgi:glycosyltransferase involved in cell wall biosynthesis